MLSESSRALKIHVGRSTLHEGHEIFATNSKEGETSSDQKSQHSLLTPLNKSLNEAEYVHSNKPVYLSTHHPSLHM